MKRLISLLIATLLLSTAAGAQTPAPAGEAPVPSAASAPSPPPAAAPAVSEAPATAKPDEAQELPTVAILSLEANKAAQEIAPGLTLLIASRLAESPRLRVLPQQADATGARYIVTGRVDQFGDTFLLTVTLLDTVHGRSLARPRAEASSAEELPRIADALGEQLLAELAPAGKASPAQPLLGSVRETPGGGLVLGLRINNTFISNLATLNPGADVELGYAFHPEWVGFLQVGITFVRSTEEGQEGRLKILPSVLGARHYYRIQQAFRPYWGLGLGVQLSFGQFGIFQSTGPLPSVIGFFGAEYVIANRVGLNLEAGTNLAQATLGLAENGLGDGLNLDLTAGLSYRF